MTEFATLAPPHDAPFQLKILYRTPDGGVYLRVLTQVRPVTENKELAETDMNPAVIGELFQRKTNNKQPDAVLSVFPKVGFSSMVALCLTSTTLLASQKDKLYTTVTFAVIDMLLTNGTMLQILKELLELFFLLLCSAQNVLCSRWSIATV